MVDEPIIDSDDQRRRLAWTAVSAALPLRHYNASVQVFAHEGGSRVVTADLLPNEAAATVAEMMDQGMAVMARTLDRLARS